MGNFIRLVVTLTGIAAAASFGLSAVYNATHEMAEEYKRQEAEAARREVMPGANDAVFEEVSTDVVIDGRPFVYYDVVAGGAEHELIGRTFTAYGKGYSSTIETIVGVNPVGEVTGIKITFQQETPGLGAKVEEVASKNTLWDVISGNAKDESGLRPWFQTQFDGKDPSELKVVKSRGQEGILAITGATISSQAVTESVRRGLEELSRLVQAGGGDEQQPETSDDTDSDGGA